MVRGVAGPVDSVSNIERWSGPMENAKHIALRALTGAFIDRDPSVVERYFAPDYIQHNPVIPSGRTAIPGLIAGLSKEFSRHGRGGGQSGDGARPLCRLGTETHDRRRY